MSLPETYEQEQELGSQLPLIIPCGAVALHAYNLDATLKAALDKTTLLFEHPDASSISADFHALKMLAGPARTPLNETGLGLVGRIELAEPLDNQQRERVFYYNDDPANFLHSSDANKSLSVSDIDRFSAFRISHVVGMDLAMFIGRSSSTIFVANHFESSNDDQFVKPVEPGILSRVAQFTAFADSFFHTVDFMASLREPTRRYVSAHFDINAPVPLAEAPEVPEAGETAVAEVHITEPEDILFDPDTVTLDDIGGLETQRAILKRFIRSYELLDRHPHLISLWNARRPGGILLHGPAGAGKKTLVRGFANDLGAELRRIQSSDIYGMYVGDSEGNMKKVFTDAAKYDGRLVLFFDKIDTMLGIGRGGDSTRRSVTGVFQQESENLRTVNPQAVVVATTQNLDNVHEDLRTPGRFDMVLQTERPNHAALKDIITLKMQQAITISERKGFKPYDTDNIDISRFAHLMADQTGANVVEVLRRAQFNSMIEHAEGLELDPEFVPVPINMAYIEKIITEINQQ